MIEVEGLTKRYGPHTAIRNLSFQVRQGEILGFLGPNGAGKTTTMRILAGYFPASEGSAKVSGFDVDEHPLEVKRRVGYLPEHPPLYPEMSVDSYLRFVATIKGVPSVELEGRLLEMHRLCGLHGYGSRLIKHLSKGYRQRVGLAQALIHHPEVVILDEPTVGLDPKQIIEVREMIKSLGGEHTIILSTHILPEVSMTCERVIILNKGGIAAVDSPKNLTDRLSRGTLIDVQASGTPQLLEERLRALPGVQSVQVGETVDGISTLHVEVDRAEAADLRPAIARSVIEGGFELYEMKAQAMSLEEVFLKLTTEEPPQALLETGPPPPDASGEPDPAGSPDEEGALP